MLYYNQKEKERKYKIMMHSIKEVYKIVGDNNHNYSAKAVQFLNHVNKWTDRKTGDCYPLPYKSGSKEFRIYDNLERTAFHIGYLYGEKHYFDSAEERAEYRDQASKSAAARKQERINTVNVWKSPYTGELFEIPADFIPSRQEWELVEIKMRNAD